MPQGSFKTLIEMLRFRAEEIPDKPAFSYAGETCSFGGMWNRVNRFAAYLQRLGIGSGDRVVLALPNGHEFFSAFYGAQRAGAVAVPLFPGFSPERILTTARDCRARIVVTASDTAADRLGLLRELAARQGTTVATVSDGSDSVANGNFPTIAPADIAFIQYTSGSTGNPKGVQISQDNLLTNIRQMITAMRITEDDIFVSWLPVYHDMGLILKTMVPFYMAAELHLLPTSLRNVGAWLRTIDQHKATFTAAPDFAYRLCVQHIRNPDEHDLTTLRVALNAAEPVRHKTILDFEMAFGLKNVMVAAYGLAEATVGVSIWPPGQSAKVDRHGHVSVGRPFSDIEIAIIVDDKSVGPGKIGEIAIKTSAQPPGYFDNPEATRALHWRPDYVLSGDLGYVDAEGDLFIVGRKKNTIIQAGRNLYPQEMEEIVDLLPTVRRSIAIGIERGRIEGEQTYIFAEIRKHVSMSEDDLQDVVVSIVSALHQHLGFRPGRVYLVKPKTIPITYNGKYQHDLLKQSYLGGELLSSGCILYPDY